MEVTCNALRTAFALAMSEMYRREVPQYGDLVQIVKKVNDDVLAKSPRDVKDASTMRLSLERHGAIRVGTPDELRTIRRIFELLGMRAVEYYDLSVAGLPMHATAFRPVDSAALDENPFRVFTTLLRPELLRSMEARELALTLLSQREVFTEDLKELLDVADRQGGRLTEQQAEVFILQALLTFSWRPVAAATHEQYMMLNAEHPILADISCFRSIHINHLTPRTLDISAAQIAMKQAGLQAKCSVEGPPARKHPILLRQTSFLALEESVLFPDPAVVAKEFTQGHHKARFGEIEQRGAAVTPAGRSFYDQLHVKAMACAAKTSDQSSKESVIAQVFQGFPDDWEQLRKQGLVYCEYKCSADLSQRPFEASQSDSAVLLDRLVEQGVIEALPITYEDFLPFSAAGIFQSNLGNGQNKKPQTTVKEAFADQQGLEEALGCPILDPDSLYQAIEKKSIDRCIHELRLRGIL
ncbi:hypothetical protein KC345_g4323 [Hortaea werneckii]|nr:hypothetical protein KC345_g4323 [Hortaea werneckii]